MPEGRQHCILDRILCVGRIPQMSSGLPNECGKLARHCSFHLSQSQIVSAACGVLSFVDYCQCCPHHLYPLKAQRRLFHCNPVSKRNGGITSGCSSRSATNWGDQSVHLTTLRRDVDGSRLPDRRSACRLLFLVSPKHNNRQPSNNGSLVRV